MSNPEIYLSYQDPKFDQRRLTRAVFTNGLEIDEWITNVSEECCYLLNNPEIGEALGVEVTKFIEKGKELGILFTSQDESLIQIDNLVVSVLLTIGIENKDLNDTELWNIALDAVDSFAENRLFQSGPEPENIGQTEKKRRVDFCYEIVRTGKRLDDLSIFREFVETLDID